MELTPVDFSSKFITELVTNCFCQNVGKIFHLTNTTPEAPKWLDVTDWLQKMGFSIDKIPFSEWIKM